MIPPIKQVESTIFLGIHIDQNMTWKVHINQIASTIAKNVGILTRIAYLLPRTIRLNLYYTLVYPYLTYCNLVWAGTYATRLSKLVILQEKAVRVVAGVKKWEYSGPSFVELGLLMFGQIREFQIGKFFSLVYSIRYLEVSSITPLTFIHTSLEIHLHT